MTNHSKNEIRQKHMKITMNITIFSKGVPQYNHSLVITFTVSKITIMFVNLSLSDFLFLYNVMVHCANRDDLFGHFCVSSHLCCVFASLFFLCFLCRMYFLLVVLCKPSKTHCKYEITHIVQK